MANSLPRKKSAPPVTIERGSDHVTIHPRNLLKAKAVVMLDGPPVLDETAIARAEKALQGLSGHFNGWMEEAARELADATEALAQATDVRAARAELFRIAHDMRGQAATLGFPLAGRVASSLCQLLEFVGTSEANPAIAMLIQQHVDAIRAITREGVNKEKHRIGETLARELEAITERLTASSDHPSLH